MSLVCAFVVQLYERDNCFSHCLCYMFTEGNVTTRVRQFVSRVIVGGVS